jgi:hypothetical protein
MRSPGRSPGLSIGDNQPNNPGSVCEQRANNVNNPELMAKAQSHSQSFAQKSSKEIAAGTLIAMRLLNFSTDLNTELI